ncbi:hypothetical protein J6590_036516 [Homalodisca vitripennis]|nr:hypothetical protein J6590_036516 [Homalodisca vitripennis]
MNHIQSDCSNTIFDIVNLSELMKDVFSVACCKVSKDELPTHLTSPCLEIEKPRPNADAMDTTRVNKMFEINSRQVYAIRSIGKGQSAAAMLCAITNLPSPPSKFTRYNQILVQSLQKVASSTMKEAVEQAVSINKAREICQLR